MLVGGLPLTTFILRFWFRVWCRRRATELNDLESALVDRLELNTEEHGSDVREDERFKLLNEHILDVPHLVVAHKHVGLRADVDEVRADLVVHRDDVKAPVRAFHGVLTVLVVVVDTAVSKQVSLVVLVSEVLRTEARVEREEDFLGDIHCVGSSDFVLNLHVVAFFCSDCARGDFLLRNRVEAIEEVK